MIESIKNILFNIGDTISILFEVLLSSIQHLISIIEYLSYASRSLPALWVVLPRAWTLVLPSFLGVVVVYKLMGRD